MKKKSNAAIIIPIAACLLVGGASVGIAIWANKEEKALKDTTDYSLEKDRQLIVGTQKTINDNPVFLSVRMNSSTDTTDYHTVSLQSDTDMKSQSGQNSASVWYDLSSWAQTILGDGVGFSDFIGDGGYLGVSTSINGGSIVSSELQLVQAGVLYFAPATTNGDLPKVAKANVVYQ